MYPFKYDEDFQRKCSNCMVLDRNEKPITKLSDVDESISGHLQDVSNWEALSLIYGIAHDDLKTKLSHYIRNSVDLKIEGIDEMDAENGNILDSCSDNFPLVLCQNCASIMLEMYRIHKVFLRLTHKDSLLAEILKDFGGHASEFLESDIKVEAGECFISSDIVIEESEAMNFNLVENNEFSDSVCEEVKFDPLCMLETEMEVKVEPGFADDDGEAETVETITPKARRRKRTWSSKRRSKNSKSCFIDDDDSNNSDIDDSADDDIEYIPNEQSDSDISDDDDDDADNSDPEYGPSVKQKKKSNKPTTAVQQATNPKVIVSSFGGNRPRAILPKPPKVLHLPLLPVPIPVQNKCKQESDSVPTNFVILNPVSLIPQETSRTNSGSDNVDESDCLPENRMCSVCRKIFMSKQNLRRHLLTHAKVPIVTVDVPPFQCPRCPKGFSGMFNLREHCVRVHKIDVRKADKDIEIVHEEYKYDTDFCSRSSKYEKCAEQH